ncbi:serine/threonine-protein kinase [Nonomuraea sp. NPDC001699]
MRGDHYLLAGRYRLVEQLGQGGAGTVWRALDETLDREVAVKQVRVPPGLSPHQRAEFAGRAIHEARSAGRLRDPAIVLVHDVVLDGDQPWIIMDLVTGRSLDKVIKENGPLPPPYAARIGLQVLSALEVAHAHGILHHDVKPANILLDADGSAMLTDFGIAVPMDGQGDGGVGSGSPGYMAPERLNEQAPGPASDLWSLGASLYTAVEGRAPFERQLPAAVAAAVLLHEPPFPARAGREFGGLLMAMLAKEPAARPTAAQVREVLSGAPVRSGPIPVRRRRWLLPVAIASGVAVLGAGGWYAVGAAQPETGRYAAAPDPCRLLSDAQAAELMRGAARRSATRDGECQWVAGLEERQGRRITVRTWIERPDGGLGGPQVALRRFTSEKGTRSAAEGTRARVAVGEVGDVAGVGEAAFVQHRFELLMSSSAVGRFDSTVLFRSSNLLGEVVWHRDEVSVKAPVDKETALRVARLVSGALPR